MKAPESVSLAWRKSSYSATDNGCVEVAWDVSATLVRDSKDRSVGALAVQQAQWQAFLARVR